MGKSRVKLELIQDHKTRKNTFLKRKAGLIKKISELSILCDIKACLIINDSHQEYIDGVDQQEIWPADSNQVQELINLYKQQPVGNQRKRTENLSSFIENQKRKVASEVEKLKTKRIKTTEKYCTWDSRFNYLSEKELRNFASVLEKKIENMKQKLEVSKSTTNIQDSNMGSSDSQEEWDYPELSNQTPCPINVYGNNIPFTYDNFFQEFTTSDFQITPSVGVNSVDYGYDLTVDNYQFGDAENNWLMKHEIGGGECYNFESSSMTMQQQQQQQLMELLKIGVPFH